MIYILVTIINMAVTVGLWVAAVSAPPGEVTLKVIVITTVWAAANVLNFVSFLRTMFR